MYLYNDNVLLSDEDPDGVVLESPFNNIRDAAIRHPFTVVSFFLTFITFSV